MTLRSREPDVMAALTTPDLPDDGHYARNLIGGRWRFPAPGDVTGEPLGPVLTVGAWRSPEDLEPLFAHPRCADGAAHLFALSERDLGVRLPHRAVFGGAAPVADVLRRTWLTP